MVMIADITPKINCKFSRAKLNLILFILGSYDHKRNQNYDFFEKIVTEKNLRNLRAVVAKNQAEKK
jgi:hypothetical protein